MIQMYIQNLKNKKGLISPFYLENNIFSLLYALIIMNITIVVYINVEDAVIKIFIMSILFVNKSLRT